MMSLIDGSVSDSELLAEDLLVMDESKYQLQHEQLLEFLATAELSQFYDAFVSRLKVHSVAQIKYVQEEDLVDIGMPKGDIHRLMKLYKKHAAHPTALSKLKKKLRKSGEDGTSSPSKSSLRRSRPISVSMREGQSSRSGLHAGMISAPQNDFRHTLHVGYDGTVFGDASFIDNDRLSLYTGQMNDEMTGSSLSLPICDHRQSLLNSQSDISMISDSTSFVGSMISSDTLTDVSSLQDVDDDDAPKSHGIDSNIIDEACTSDNDGLSDLTIPDFSTLDLGPSLEDEIMKMFGSKSSSSVKTESPPHNSTSSSSPPRVTNGTPFSETDGYQTVVRNKKAESSSHDVGTTDSAVSGGKKASPLLEAEKLRNGQKEKLPETLPTVAVCSTATTTTTTTTTTEKPITDRIATNGSDYISAVSLRVPPKTNIAPGESALNTVQHSYHSAIPKEVQGSQNGNGGPPIPAKRTSVENGNGKIAPVVNLGASQRGSQRANRSLDNQLATNVPPPSLLPSAPSSLSSSSEFLRANMRHVTATRFASSSSCSLPAKTGLGGSDGGVTRSSGFPKAVDGSDTEANFLQRIKDSSILRFGGLRSSVTARTAKSGLPTENLNMNMQFFDRLREQEMQMESATNGSSGTNEESSRIKITPSEQRRVKQSSSMRVRSSTASPSGRKAAPSSSFRDSPQLRDFVPSFQPPQLQQQQYPKGNSTGLVMAVVPSVCSGVEKNKNERAPTVAHDEVARLSSRSNDSCSHDSENSNTTQPSDEGVYSDDSVTALSTDDITRSAAYQTSSIATEVRLDASPAHERFTGEFWTSPVDFQQVAKRKLCASRAFDASSGRSNVEVGTFSKCESASEYKVHDQLQLMMSVANNATSEECLYALSETDGNTDAAIRLLLLRQLVLSSELDEPSCQEALVAADWDLELALSRLAGNVSGRESPEIINV